MKVNKKELLDALKIACLVTPKKATFPVLRCVKLGDGKVVATNLEMIVTVPLDIQDNESGASICMDAHVFKRIVASLETDEVEITPNEELNKVSIGGHFQEMSCFPAEEMPTDLPEMIVNEKHLTRIKKDSLENVIKVLASAKEEKQLGFHLSSVQFEDGKAAATDGHRLHEVDAVSTPDKLWLLPGEAAKIVAAAAGKNDEELTFIGFSKKVAETVVTEDPDPELLEGLTKKNLLQLNEDYFGIEVSSKARIAEIVSAMTEVMQKTADEAKGKATNPRLQMVACKLEKAEFLIQLTSGRFPDYKSFLPSEGNGLKKLTITRADVKRAFDQAKIMMSSKFRAAKIKLNGGIDIEVENPDFGKYERLSIPVKKGTVSPELTIGINLEFLQDALSTVPDDKTDIELGVIAPDKPLYVMHPGFLGFIMPMRA